MLKNYLAFDLRALALMRMGMAAMIMLDVCNRLTDLEVFYSNTGVVPLNMLFENMWNRYFISVHTMSGMWQVQLVLFLFAFFCAMMLFIGYRTKLFTVLSWFMMLSLHNRNGLILQGGDDLLRMVLFWGIFIPWGAFYSYDGIRSPYSGKTTNIFNVAVFAYVLQVCYIYSGSALLKGPEWSKDFTALYYTYSLDQISYPITKYFYYNSELLRNFTAIAYYFELLIPILFFIPFKHAMFRTTAVITIIVFHLLNLSTLFIGLFPVIGMVTVLGILPSETMNALERFTLRIKGIVKASFLGIGYAANRIIRWKEQIYELGPIHYKIRTALLIFLTIFIFDWNFSNLSFINSKLSDNFRFIGYSLRLDQSWGMFAPGVFKDDGWYVVEGITESNEHIDLLRPKKALSYDKPKNVVNIFKNDRWRKYSENFIFSDNEFMRGYFCNYYKHKWNEKHPERYVHTVQVIYMEEFTLPDYKYSLPKKNILWECVD
ncbi:MAG: hypothetical protein H0X46_06190 [Bacteroidetes bacterium]|nr:hypothetical protein [Bacteroidota bacterium]